MISRNHNGQTTYEKCHKEGCDKLVRRTASMRKLRRGQYCSKAHTPRCVGLTI